MELLDNLGRQIGATLPAGQAGKMGTKLAAQLCARTVPRTVLQWPATIGHWPLAD